MEEEKDIIIHIFGPDTGLFEKLFKKGKEIIINKEYGNIKKRKLLKSTKKDDYSKFLRKMNLSIIGYKYPLLNQQNIKKIIYDVFETLKATKNKRNILLKFENTYIKEFSTLINKLETDKPFILFNIEDNANIANLFNNFKDPKYISYMIDCSKIDPNKFYSKIITYILEKCCYYNELGNKLDKFFPGNLLYKEPKGFLNFNILLTGESRAGKSSFINRVFNKLISYESSKMESTTLEINSYELYPPEEENQNKLKKGYGGIRFYDTPGLVKTKELNSFKKIKSQLKEIFNKIQIIYFFIKAQSNIEQCIDMLEYIKDINIQREKNKINKIPIIFIKNGEDLKVTTTRPIVFQELKKELEKHKLMDLYDPLVNINNKTKNYNIDNFFEEEEESDNKYGNYIEGNIIQVYIPDGKNIDKIFSTTYEYIIKNNKDLIHKDFSSYKENVTILIKYYIKSKLENKSLSNNENKEYNEIYHSCNDIVQIFCNNCSILYNLDELKTKSKAAKIIGIIGLVISIPLIIFIIPAFWVGAFGELISSQIINNIAIKYGFGEEDLYNYGLNTYVYEKSNDNKEIDREKLEKKCGELFEDLIYYIGPIQCLLKSKELFDQIMNLFDDLKSRSDEKWNEFKVTKI